MYNIIDIGVSFVKHLADISDFVNFSVLRKPTFTIIEGHCAETAPCVR